MISSLEIFQSGKLYPYENLAQEKYLFDTLPDNTLRLFLWRNDNTVVIGQNQNPWVECNCKLLEKEGGFVVRRMSGGGAVFHDKGNLNFTFICSEENYNLSLNLEIIKKACEALGITAEISGRNDILTDGRKFSGNAFYHRDKKALHHGTLLISSSSEKIKRYLTPKMDKLAAKGVKSVASRVINLKAVCPTLNTKIMAKQLIIAAEIVLNLKGNILTPFDNEETKNNANLFGSWDYIYGKTPPFTFSARRRFSFGDCEVNLNLKNGRISEIKVYTDSLDFELSKKIESALLGAQLETAEIEKRLTNILTEDIAKDVITLIKNSLTA